MSEATGAVDIGAFIPNQTGVLHVKKPGTNDPIRWDVTMAGPSHPKTIAQTDIARRDMLRRSEQIEQARVNGKKYKSEHKDSDESRREFVESIVARIVTWSPVKIGSETFEFDEKTAVDLLLRPEMGSFVAQMYEFLDEEKSFTPDSAKN